MIATLTYSFARITAALRMKCAVAQIAHGFGRNAVDELVPFFALEHRRLGGFDNKR
jgi:hypothetical protein